MAQEYISQTSGEVEGRVTKKLPKQFSRTESPILGALFKLDEFLLSPQVRTCSIAVPGTSRNNDSENQEPTGDRSLGNSCPEAVFSTYHSSKLKDSEQEETHDMVTGENDGEIFPGTGSPETSSGKASFYRYRWNVTSSELASMDLFFR